MPDTAPEKLNEAEALALTALSECVEAFLESSGSKGAREFMRALASRVATPPEDTVVSIRDPKAANRVIAARVWLQRKLPGWLARYG